MDKHSTMPASQMPETEAAPDTMIWGSVSALKGWYASWNGERWDLNVHGLSLEGFKARYPDLTLMTSETWAREMYLTFRIPAQEISEARFTDMLDVLPPYIWNAPGKGQGKSFVMEEVMRGGVSDIYVEWQGKYYTLRDYGTLSHNEIITRVIKVLDKQ
ncbi:hypothetical protein [Nissabacter archeti]|uniref:hypothetical protein n=1 Tax=Nissabacter archeti TaxID=1917880 RepID=UPI0009351183|nr:hypothetical protein [Nissabacter archeti]